MNDLTNPFQSTHPTAIQTSLIANALFAKFDPTGRYVAAPRINGSLVLWDLDTKSPVKMVDGHVRAVTSVDWSRNSRYILTASKDWNVIIWDLASRYEPLQRHATLRFDAPVTSASFHPRNSKIVLVLLATGEAYLVDRRKAHRARTELVDAVKPEEGEELEPESQKQRTIMTAARFDPSGRFIFAGTANGMLLVFHTRSKALIARHRIAGAGSMKNLDFAKNGRRLVTNSSDRILRQFTLPNYQPYIPTPAPAPALASNSLSTCWQCNNVNEQELEPTHRFNDPINRTAWHIMSYSPDGEWLAGGSADPATHKVYIWDIGNDGQFATALDGGREPLVHIHWHPKRSLIASTTNHGNILIWHCPKAERWGAFAGGFEEIDENIVYEEREDEFDIEDEAVLQERKQKAEDKGVDIDGFDDEPLPATSKQTTSSNKPPNGNNGNDKANSTTSSNDNNSKPAEVKSGSASAMNSNNPAIDEDLAWADEEPDDDTADGEGKDWRMRINRNVEELAEELGA